MAFELLGPYLCLSFSMGQTGAPGPSQSPSKLRHEETEAAPQTTDHSLQVKKETLVKFFPVTYNLFL